MTAPDAYWEAIGQKAKKAEALELERQGNVKRNAQITVIAKRPQWKKLRQDRKRGNKILCLVCMIPKPRKDFSKIKKSGYVLTRCRPCNNRLSHKKRIARESSS